MVLFIPDNFDLLLNTEKKSILILICSSNWNFITLLLLNKVFQQFGVQCWRTVQRRNSTGTHLKTAHNEVLNKPAVSSSAYLERLLLTSARRWTGRGPFLSGPWSDGDPWTCPEEAGVLDVRGGERTALFLHSLLLRSVTREGTGFMHQPCLFLTPPTHTAKLNITVHQRTVKTQKHKAFQ